MSMGIFTYIWLMFMGNLGRYIYIYIHIIYMYISYMDGKELLNGDDVDCQHMDETSKCLIAT